MMKKCQEKIIIMKLSGLGKNTLYQFIYVNIIKNFKLALSTEPRVNKCYSEYCINNFGLF